MCLVRDFGTCGKMSGKTATFCRVAGNVLLGAIIQQLRQPTPFCGLVMIRGDHIFVHCNGYSHHGIYCGDERVIHFDFDPQRKIASTVFQRDLSLICETTLESFANGKEIQIRQYAEADSIEQVVLRAEERIGQSGYSLFANNCEHFAVWCKTGEAESTQVHACKKATKPIQAGILAAVLVRGAIFLPPPMRVAAYTITLGASAGAALARYVQQRNKDVASGKS